MHSRPSSPANSPINRTVTMNAPVATVWQALTVPSLMEQWMAETPIEIITDWRVGSQILIRGDLHGIPFENHGTVLQFEPALLLQYSHLSSISHLPDRPQSYSVTLFQLTPGAEQTTLSVTISNFPTEAIYKHLAFYWPVAVSLLKRLVEEQTWDSFQ